MSASDTSVGCVVSCALNSLMDAQSWIKDGLSEITTLRELLPRGAQLGEAAAIAAELQEISAKLRNVRQSLFDFEKQYAHG